MLDAHPRGDGPRRHPRPARRRLRALQRRRRAGWCRTSRRCSTTTPSCVGLYARWGTPLGDRVATMDGRLPAARAAHRRGRARLGARRRQRGRGGTLLRLDAATSSTDVLGADDGRWATELFAVTGHLRARHLDAAAAARPRRLGALRRRTRAGCSPPAERGSGRPATTRSSPPGTGWRSPGSCDAGRLLGREEYVDAALDAGDLLADLHLVDGRLRRVSRDGTGRHPRGRARGLRRGGRRLPGPVRGHRRRALADPCARPCSTRRSRSSGPTTAASTTPPTTASDWSPDHATRATTPARRVRRPRCTPCSPPTP